MIVVDTTQGLTADDGESFATRVTSSTFTVIKTGNATLNGIMINSHSSGTIELRDGASVNPAVSATIRFGTMTLSAVATTGERYIDFFGARFSTGIVLYAAGTVDLTVLYK